MFTEGPEDAEDVDLLVQLLPANPEQSLFLVEAGTSEAPADPSAELVEELSY